MVLNLRWFLSHEGHLAMSEDVFDCHNLGMGGEVLLSSVGLVTETLPNILQSTGQPLPAPPPKELSSGIMSNVSGPYVNRVKVEKPSSSSFLSPWEYVSTLNAQKIPSNYYIFPLLS